MKRPTINKKTLKIFGAAFFVLAVLIAASFAIPALSGTQGGKTTTGVPVPGGDVGTIPSPAYSGS